MFHVLPRLDPMLACLLLTLVVTLPACLCMFEPRLEHKLKHGKGRLVLISSKYKKLCLIFLQIFFIYLYYGHSPVKATQNISFSFLNSVIYCLYYSQKMLVLYPVFDENSRTSSNSSWKTCIYNMSL